MLAIAIIALVVFCYMGYMRQSAETIFAVFPLLAVGITPILGSYVDHKGKAASMLVLGSLLLIFCHLTFAFILPMFKGSQVGADIAEHFFTSQPFPRYKSSRTEIHLNELIISRKK